MSARSCSVWEAEGMEVQKLYKADLLLLGLALVWTTALETLRYLDSRPKRWKRRREEEADWDEVLFS